MYSLRVFLYYHSKLLNSPVHINRICPFCSSTLTPLWMRRGRVVMAALMTLSLRNIVINLLNFLLSVYFKIWPLWDLSISEYAKQKEEQFEERTGKIHNTTKYHSPVFYSRKNKGWGSIYVFLACINFLLLFCFA